jgi:hypothetical protein
MEVIGMADTAAAEPAVQDEATTEAASTPTDETVSTPAEPEGVQDETPQDDAAAKVAQKIADKNLERTEDEPEAPTEEVEETPDEETPGTSDTPADEETPDGGDDDAQYAEFVADAAEFGFTEDDIEALGEERVTKLIAKQYAAVGERATEPQPTQEPEPEPETPPETPAQPADTGLDLGFLEELEDAVGEDVANGLTGFIKSTKARLDALTAENAELTSAVVETFRSRQDAEIAQKEEEVKEFDGLLASLGKDFKDVFGTGTINDLATVQDGRLVPRRGHETHLANRSAVYDSMDTIAKGMAAKGRKVPSTERLFKMAVATLDDVQTVQTKQQERDLKKKLRDPRRRSTAAAKPGGGTPPKLSPEEEQAKKENAAADRIAKKNREG